MTSGFFVGATPYTLTGNAQSLSTDGASCWSCSWPNMLRDWALLFSGSVNINAAIQTSGADKVSAKAGRLAHQL